MNIIFSIIVTESKYLNIIEQYLDILLKAKLINVVHIWNYIIPTNNNEYKNIFNLFQKNTKYILYEPPLPDEKRGHFYQYYSKYIEDDDILIKCDDRIVYMDLDKFNKFVENITQDGLYIPNIVNNDVCAYFQHQEGCHTLFNYNIDKTDLKNIVESIGNFKILSDWHKEYDKANSIHKMFLKNKNKFIIHKNNNENNIIEYGSHIHLNIFGLRGKYAKEMFKELTPLILFTDQTYFGLAPAHNKIKHKICLEFICSYLAFDTQNKNQLEKNYLSKYEKLTQTTCNNWKLKNIKC